jgi:hypothetical protein
MNQIGVFVEGKQLHHRRLPIQSKSADGDARTSYLFGVGLSNRPLCRCLSALPKNAIES